MNKCQLDTDVIIIGGGLTGCTLAAILARQDIRCLIIEEQEKPSGRSSVRIDPRALAITCASENILRTANAWANLAEDKIGYFREMLVWETMGEGEIHFDSADICEPTLGYIIEQTVLEDALRRTLEQATAVEWQQPAAPVSVIKEDDRIVVEIEDNRFISASLVVAADGKRSKIRALTGIAYPQHDYHQQAVACVVQTGRPHRQVARQRFLATGPLAFLPMADQHRCGIVWSTSPDHANALLAMDEHGFNQALAEAFEDIAGEIVSSGPRVSFPLHHAQAENYCQSRLALIGDAAHCVHPLAGQGANLGLLDAATLAEVIIDAKRKDRDIGSISVLRRYERWRKGENFIVLKVLQGFKYLFENKLGTIKHLRKIGLNLTDAISPLKHSIMRYAMGLSGDLPVCARKVS